MPILSGSVTFSRYRVEHSKKPPSDAKRWMLKGLKSMAFEPVDKKSEEDRSAGFAELEDRDGTDFNVGNLYRGNRALLCWRIDTLRVPSALLKEELARWAKVFEQENDRKPARSEKNEAKANFKQQLRDRALPSVKTHDIAWDLEHGELQIWAASRKVVDEILGTMETAFEIKLSPHTPTAMSQNPDALKPTLSLVTGNKLEASHG
ncbi:MAG: recombination-associated protein RdgC [Myxococcota bacterium]|nr:recombination-associated protein RdgC [Myxococcota bacterium]